MSQFHGIEVPPEIIRAAVAGDMAAHEAIYRHCSRPVYSIIRRLVPNIATADDLLQDVFVEILRSIEGYTAQGPFGGWVRAIAVNKCLMHLRSPWHRSIAWLETDEIGDSSALALAGSSLPLESFAAAADLERALESLPALTRSVVWLHDVEGYKHQEIAELLGRTTAFSKSQLSRAHARLRQLLDPHPPEVAGGSLPCTRLSTSY
ncbi:MAG: RNA polymerase sigma factor [Povalibacter sp.]